MKKFLLITTALFFFSESILAQAVNDLFSPRTSLSKDYSSIARQYQPMELNRQKLSQLIDQSPQQFILELPFENKQYQLELKKVNITTAGFTVKQASANGVQSAGYTPGIFYQGKITGLNKSFATISFYNDQVYAVISDEKSNITLGAIEGGGAAASEYVMYRDTELKVANPFTCFTGETPADGNNSPGISASVNTPNAVGEPVDIYYECDFAFYQNKGSSVANVVNYVLGFFNNVALLYANENIHVQVSQIKVWTTTDPYASLTTTSSVLSAFAGNMATDPYVGDYAHFLSTRSLGGGIAYLLGNPCASARQFRSAVSAINPSYQNFPTYSWTVEVTTHEQGHNFGSNHTQWCGWTGGALDNCYTTEGGCAQGPAPTNGGTIMSYCHLTSNGINFSNGFGQQPGDRIRTVIGNAACFGSCRMTISIAKTDASCGNNGSATITPANGTAPYTYTWSNGQTVANPSNLVPGTYYVSVKDAVNCEVMGQVIIGNSGTTLSVSVTPNGTVAYCTGGEIILNATNNAAYSYQWRKDGNPISGATAYNYTASAPGSYTVSVTSGPCNTITAPVQVVEAPVPSASITAAGPVTFCSGGNVILNTNIATGYQYQWFRDGSVISGATGSSYSATITGNYTVRISAGSCQATSSATTVTVNPVPSATITVNGVTAFCDGGSVTLNANTGAGLTYQWRRNGTAISGATQTAYAAATAGAYTVVVSLGSCSVISAATNVAVFPLPAVTVSPNTGTIEKFRTQSLTAAGASSYNWGVQPGLVSNTANSAVLRPLTTTTYTIEGTDNNNCKNTATATITVIGCGDVTNFNARVLSPGRVLVSWINPDGSTADSLQYRIAGTAGWTSIYVTGNQYELNNLRPGTDYEYRVIALCNTSVVFLPSAINTFKTPALQGGLYIKLFPNPAVTTGRLEIISAADYKLSVDVYNSLGQKVMKVSGIESLPAGQVVKQINVSRLQPGIYGLAIWINGKMHKVKMEVAR